MEHSALLGRICEKIDSRKGEGVFFVGIDGVDAAGKTTFASKLSRELRVRGLEVVEASMDGFHNPREVRYRMGRDSPEGYYRDSFNIEALESVLLTPLKEGSPYRTSVFDYRVDKPTDEPVLTPKPGSILVFEGVFSFRSELRSFWDYTIYLHISPEESLRRGVERDPGEKDEIERKYRVRYVPGQRLYHEECKPLESADLVVDYTNPDDPRILRGLRGDPAAGRP